MRRLTKLTLCIALAGWALLLSACATTPDWRLAPTYGTARLTGGFKPDPYYVDVIAGGSINLGGVGFSGSVAEAPDVDLLYAPTNYELWIYVADASGDTVLLINDPSGNWHFSDDADGLGVNPGIRFPHPEAGLYDIWVGSYAGGYYDAVLAISERAWFR